MEVTLGFRSRIAPLMERAPHAIASSTLRRQSSSSLRPIPEPERHGYVMSGRVSDFFGMPLHEYVKAL
jgi:hypothetical protein